VICRLTRDNDNRFTTFQAYTFDTTLPDIFLTTLTAGVSMLPETWIAKNAAVALKIKKTKEAECMKQQLVSYGIIKIGGCWYRI